VTVILFISANILVNSAYTKEMGSTSFCCGCNSRDFGNPKFSVGRLVLYNSYISSKFPKTMFI